MFTEEDIVHEVGSHFVLRVGVGKYEVCRNGITHADIRARISFTNDPHRALRVAIERCDALEASLVAR